MPYGVGARGAYIHMYDKYNERFVGLVRDYHDVILGSFFGHEHNDAVKLVFDEGELVNIVNVLTFMVIIL